MQCQLQISQDTLLMGGHQDKIIEFNLSQGQETNLVCALFTLVVIRQDIIMWSLFSHYMLDIIRFNPLTSMLQ